MRVGGAIIERQGGIKRTKQWNGEHSVQNTLGGVELCTQIVFQLGFVVFTMKSVIRCCQIGGIEIYRNLFRFQLSIPVFMYIPACISNSITIQNTDVLRHLFYNTYVV